MMQYYWCRPCRRGYSARGNPNELAVECGEHVPPLSMEHLGAWPEGKRRMAALVKERRKAQEKEAKRVRAERKATLGRKEDA